MSNLKVVEKSRKFLIDAMGQEKFDEFFKDKSSININYDNVTEKSRKLLVQVMGQKDYDKFIEDGKIEVVHKLGKDSKETTYSLDENAKVFNVTTSQSYCIEPICPDNLPIHDQIAIKFSYLKNNIKRVEEVANKRNTYITSTVRGIRDIHSQEIVSNANSNVGHGILHGGTRIKKPGYLEYVEYLEARGWSRAHVDINEHSGTLVTLNSVSRGHADCAIDIKCPAGQKITIAGTCQAEGINAHSLRVRFADVNDVELAYVNPIRITKEKSSDIVVQLARLFYADINMECSGRIKRREEFFRFKEGIELNGDQHFRIYVVNPGIDISARNTKFSLEADLWSYGG